MGSLLTNVFENPCESQEGHIHIENKMHDDHASSTTQIHDLRSNEELTKPPATTSAPSEHDPEPHSEDDSISTVQRAENNQEFMSPESSVPLQRTVYPVFLVLVYSAAALYAWVIICILSHRPIGGVGYGLDQVNHTVDEKPSQWQGNALPNYLNGLYHKNEKYLKGARVVQSLVSVVTIPLTSAVCSQAAVVYIQRKRTSNGPTLRQSMALADKGWTDINLIGKLISGGWKKYSSTLLLLGLFMHLLGFAVSPVQQLFLSFQTVKRPHSNYQYLTQITDISDLYTASGGEWQDNGLNIVKLRSKLATATTKEVQPRLWSRDNATISKWDYSWTRDSDDTLLAKSQNTLVNITGNPDLFWAQLPSTTNTGLVQQFAPRINSTAKWENVTNDMLPANCNPSSDALYIQYMYQYYEIFGYDIEICMPRNMTKSPWNNERSRQDFGEELYLRMNFSSNGSLSSPKYVEAGIYTKKLSLRTTLGNFELPNHANGGIPGPLIDGNPYPNEGDKSILYERNMVNDTAWNIYKATEKLIHYGNKGPLLSTALALFGEGSLVDAQHTNLAAYADSDVPYIGCIGTFPFVSLLDQTGNLNDPTPFRPCLSSDFETYGYVGAVAKKNEILIQSLIATYFFLFTGKYSYGPIDVTDTLLENAFASSAFLANDAMMMDPGLSPSRQINYVLGVDMQIPSISQAGMIFVSILLSLDILCLFAMAIYSAWIPRWTVSLDSFAMMRIGASISDKVPLLATNHAERIKTLDETPGWVGNQSEGLDKKGQLCLGGVRPLKETQYYAGYETDRMGQSSVTEEPPGAIKREGYSLAPTGESV